MASKAKAMTTSSVVVENSSPQSIASFLVKVSRATNNNVGLRLNLKTHIEQVVLAFIRQVDHFAEESLKQGKRNTVLDRDIENAVNAFVPESDFRVRLVQRGNDVLKNFTDTKKTEGVNMSGPRTRAWLVNGLENKEVRVSKKAEVFLTAVLDQLVAELTKEANVYSQKEERKNITMPDFNQAVKKTDWLNSFLNVMTEHIRPVDEAAAKPAKKRVKKEAEVEVEAETKKKNVEVKKEKVKAEPVSAKTSKSSKGKK